MLVWAMFVLSIRAVMLLIVVRESLLALIVIIFGLALSSGPCIRSIRLHHELLP